MKTNFEGGRHKNRINKIDELQINSTTLDEMGFEVYVGKCVWNQEKEILTDDKFSLAFDKLFKENRIIKNMKKFFIN